MSAILNGKELDEDKIGFPKSFLWGAATSAHQVEGGNNNDWTEWEKRNASRLAKEAPAEFGKRPNWKDIEAEATNPSNYISGIACDHYNRYREDFDLAKGLGHNAHRFSIEWSRVEPAEGKFDETAIEHYRDVIEALRERGMEPFVTLWHWTLPVWLRDRGGISSPDFPDCFERYAGKVALEMGAKVKFWITLNEPDVVSTHSFLKGIWPPEVRNPFLYYRSLRHLISAHKKAHKAIKEMHPDSSVGIAKHQISFHIERETLTNSMFGAVGQYIWNRWLLDSIRNYQDFIGLNHYNRKKIDIGRDNKPLGLLTDLGWEFFPESIYQSLIELKPYNKPIYITENGIADAKDALRSEFIRRALKSIKRAMASGVDVRGYLHWSLLDNFEWDKGFWPRFGLIEVDHMTMERKIRPSAFAYKDIINNRTQI